MGIPVDWSAFPLPVAALLRRAENAKSARDRHDTAYFAWEVSVRLAVAARPPADVGPLVRGSLGHWVRAATVGSEPLTAQAVLEVFNLLTEVGGGKRRSPRRVTPRQLLDALPAYRNQVIGHGSVRSERFYARSGPMLVDGLVAAWAGGVFVPRGSTLVYADSIARDPAARRSARLFALSGAERSVIEPSDDVVVPDHVVPGRVYLRSDGAYTDLHPLVLYRAAEFSEQLLFFNGRGRRSAFLDYLSGEPLRGEALDMAFPGVDALLAEMFVREPADDSPDPDEDADLFGDYRILGKLGEGGMGVVYLAEQESLSRTVALKMLPVEAARDSVTVARFKREIAALGRCEHPNVVKILASGEARGTHYYAMEHIEGADLADVASALRAGQEFDAAVSTASDAVRARRAEVVGTKAPARTTSSPVTPRQSGRYRQIAEAFRDAALGLNHLHESGIIHRDVKPGNLMLTAAERRVVVMDLGLAAVGDASASITRDKGQILGTLRYMPPEQLQRSLLHVDHRADVYGLGATFYELLAGQPLFDGDTEARLLHQVLRESPSPVGRVNPAVPADLATIVSKAIEKDARARYATMGALADDLTAYLEGRPIAARPPSFTYYATLAARRNPALAAALAGMVAAIVAALAVSLVLLDEAERAKTEAVDAKHDALSAIAQREVEVARTVAAVREKESAVQRARAAAVVIASQSVAAGSPMTALNLAREAVVIDASPATMNRLRAALFASRERVVIEGHEPFIWGPGVSPDGTRLAAGVADNTARVWDFEGRELAVLRGHQAPVLSARFSPDGRHVVTASADESARVWEVTGAEIAVLRGHRKAVHSAMFSPDGTRIWTDSADGSTRVWELAGNEVAILKGASGKSCTAIFDPAGTRVLTLGRGRLRLWDLDGRELATLGERDPQVFRAAFSPDGTLIATGSWNGTTRVYSDTGEVVAEFDRGRGPVYSVAFSPRTRDVLISSAEGTAQTWGVEGDLVEIFTGHDGEVHSAVYSPDGKHVLTCSIDKTARVWSDSGTPLQTFRGHTDMVLTATYSPDGERVITSSMDGTLRVWDVHGRELDIHRGAWKSAWLVGASPGGTVLVELGRPGTSQGCRVYGIDGGDSCELDGYAIELVTSVSISPDGTRILTTAASRVPTLWDRTGKRLATFRGHEKYPTDARFSPDGRLVVAGSADAMARVWDVTGRELVVLRGHDDTVHTAEFAPDAARIVTASADQTARIWDLEANGLVRFTGHSGSVNSAAFSPDGTRVLTAGEDGTARLWDETGAELVVLRGHSGAVRSAVFSHDGALILTASADQTARIWDLDGNEVALLRGHTAALRNAVFSSDDRTVLTVADDSTCRTWCTRADDLLALAAARVTRDFTEDELTRFDALLTEETKARAVEALEAARARPR